MKLFKLAACLVVLVLGLVFAGLNYGTVEAFNPFGDVCKTNPTAPETGTDGRTSAACAPEGEDPVTGSEGILLKAANLLAIVVGIAAVIMIIVSGLKYISSDGDSNAISSAKRTLIYSIVGVVVAVLARPIVVFVINRI